MEHWALRTFVAAVVVSTPWHLWVGDPMDHLPLRLVFVIPLALLLSGIAHRIITPAAASTPPASQE